MPVASWQHELRPEHWEQGGKAAAQTILDMRAAGDYSKASTRVYEQRWMQLFGHDFAYVRLSPPSTAAPIENACH